MPEQITPKLLSWATDVDDKTIEQARQASELPFIAGHVALMPDAHFGFGSTVGSVIPTRGAIIPSAIGVDIGCGMIAGLTTLTANDLPDDLSWLHVNIAQRVPAGVGKGRDQGSPLRLHERGRNLEGPWTLQLRDRARKQLGSLGSGNHFVEVCLDETDRVWIVLHSGSRGVGNEIAKYHIDGAKDLMEQYFIETPNKDLAYLVNRTPEFEAYIADMLWAQDYALGNREMMLTQVVTALQFEVRRHVGLVDRINCHHNYTEREHHRGQNIWVTRKGAVRAREGDRGVIPGSMGAASYIVSGLGNPSSYNSCAHGAGRRLSRTAARKQLSTESLRQQMEGKTWNSKQADALLDEHPDSYKDIDDVMENQKDLVRIEHTLHQILNYKGA